MSEEEYPWFALRVKPRWEKEVSRNLRCKGYAELLPSYVRENRWSDRIKQIELPLFPGYLFASFDPRRPLIVTSTPGVLSVVGFGGKALPLDPSEVAAIQATMRSRLPRKPWEHPHQGDRVRLIAGPLKGIQGVVCAVQGEDWLILSVTLLQRAIAVRVKSRWVESLNTGGESGGLNRPTPPIPLAAERTTAWSGGAAHS